MATAPTVSSPLWLLRSRRCSMLIGGLLALLTSLVLPSAPLVIAPPLAANRITDPVALYQTISTGSNGSATEHPAGREQATFGASASADPHAESTEGSNFDTQSSTVPGGYA